MGVKIFFRWVDNGLQKFPSTLFSLTFLFIFVMVNQEPFGEGNFFITTIILVEPWGYACR